MITFELTENSSKLEDHVFAITKVLKPNKYGILKPSRGTKREDFEVVEAVILSLRYDYCFSEDRSVWSCALARVSDGPLALRFIDDTKASDCFLTRAEAEEALDARFPAEGGEIQP